MLKRPERFFRAVVASLEEYVDVDDGDVGSDCNDDDDGDDDVNRSLL